MISVKNEIIIDAPLSVVFNIASDVEKYPEFIPTYKKVKIIEQDGERMIVQREGMAWGKLVNWSSEVWISPNISIKAIQLEGLLQGMRIEWQFEEIDDRTRILLVHNFEYKRIPFIGNLIARFIIARIVSRMAEETLKGIKGMSEKQLTVGG